MAEAHAYLGAVKLWYDWDWPGAEREIRRALELNANSSNAHDAFGDYLETLGRMQEGMIEHQRAQELDPAGDSLSNSFVLNRQYDQAIEFLKKQVEIEPNNGGNHFRLSEAYGLQGRYEESIRELQQAGLLYGYKEAAEGLGRAYAKAGYKGAIRYYLTAMEEAYAQGQHRADRIAVYYMRLGDKDEAFKWLQKSYDSHEADMTTLKADHDWDPLRSDPRFKELIRRVGIPD